MLSLTGRLSFRDNIKPSDVTDDVRNELVRREVKRLFTRLVATALVTILVAWIIWMDAQSGVPIAGGRWSLGEIYSFLAIVVALVMTSMIGANLRRIRFIRSAYVTKGVVLDTKIPTWYGRGGGHRTAKVIYRFAPVEARDAPDSELLSTCASHYEGRAKLSVGGEWGWFGDDLEAGDLISVLYEPEKPTHSFIVPLKTGEV